MKVYLAGKISQNDWRHTIVDDLSTQSPAPQKCASKYDADDLTRLLSDWPILWGAAQGHDYTGPYFVRCDNLSADHDRWNCWAGDDQHFPGHGVGASMDQAGGGHGYLFGKNDIGGGVDYRPRVVEQCLTAIDRSDAVFAWLAPALSDVTKHESLTCYGTLFELGYAAARGKRIVLVNRHVGDDLWFLESTVGVTNTYGDDPLSAFRRVFRTPDVQYYDYIRSPEWREKAVSAKARAGHRCQVCNQQGQLDAHHRSYSRLGRETPADITVLCRACHSLYELNKRRANGTEPVEREPFA